MRLKGDPSRYGVLAATLHWLSAATILAMLPLGFLAAHSSNPMLTAALLRVHLPLGVCVLLLVIARLVWWTRDIRPAKPAHASRWRTRAASLNHFGLYAALLLLCGSGIALIQESGLAPTIFGQGRLASTAFERYPVLRAHLIGAALLTALLLLHLCGALYHHFVLRDRPLVRMRLIPVRESR